MEPVSVFIASVLGKIAWHKLGEDLAKDAESVANGVVKTGAKGLLARLQPSEREKTAKIAVELFVREFAAELEDKTPLTSSLAGYQDQLKRVIEAAAPDIVNWLQPETADVDLGSVERMWGGMGLDPLPAGFDWALVAKGYARAIRKQVKSDPSLRAQFDTALREQTAGSLARLAPPDPGFDLAGYREYLRKKCALLQLSAMDTSTYDRRVPLWSVFVPQTAREAAPVRDLPREILRRLRMEGHIGGEQNDEELAWLQEGHQSSPVGPVLDMIERQRLVVVLA